ncbi:hypothetical protein ACPV4B_02055 [Vibrio parahaemolyticus]|uniref:hypothetical protein n=1 Tax=Vibrio mediterranei TaxID=689 RepID=UPI0040685F30
MKPCFPSVPISLSSKSPVNLWLQQYRSTRLVFEKSHQTALSRLLPLLICGEQSSQWVFYNESQRHTSFDMLTVASSDFERIVADEKYHEEALELVHHQLPQPEDILLIKRRSQRFFTELGNRSRFDQHFAQIACLDALVCKLMLAMEKSSLEATHPFVKLCRAIKQDEARHVSLSKYHAVALGFDKNGWKIMERHIGSKLYDLLKTESQAFETLGIVLEDIFKFTGVRT